MPTLPYQLTVTAEDGRLLTAQDADGAVVRLVKLDATDANQARAILNELLKTEPSV